LINLVRERVKEHSGVSLICEHRFVGFGLTP
jgi:UDP-N-acetylenolpyruvoylglucosamine reductase